MEGHSSSSRLMICLLLLLGCSLAQIEASLFGYTPIWGNLPAFSSVFAAKANQLAAKEQTGVDKGQLAEICAKLYNKSEENSVSVEETLELLGKVANLLPSIDENSPSSSSSSSSGEKLKMVNQLIGISVQSEANCQHESALAIYVKLLNKLSQEPTALVIQQPPYEIQNTNIHNYIKHHREQQYSLCRQRLEGKVSQKVQELDPELRNKLALFKEELVKQQERSIGKEAIIDASLSYMSSATKKLTKSRKKFNRPDSNNTFQLLIAEMVLEPCKLVQNSTLQKVWEEYKRASEKFIAPSEPNRGWLSLVGVCEGILADSISFQQKAYERQLAKIPEKASCFNLFGRNRSKNRFGDDD